MIFCSLNFLLIKMLWRAAFKRSKAVNHNNVMHQLCIDEWWGGHLIPFVVFINVIKGFPNFDGFVRQL